MNKDELLKIYSAYLPYGLHVMGIHSRQLGNDSSVLTKFEKQHLLSGLSNGYAQFDNSIYGNPIELIKPILYDLSYLTKEIEHEGEIITPIVEIINDSDDIFEDMLIRLAAGLSNSNRLPYRIFVKLLSYHFNVFQLPESEYINKATLTNK